MFVNFSGDLMKHFRLDGIKLRRIDNKISKKSLNECQNIKKGRSYFYVQKENRFIHDGTIFFTNH